MSTLETIINPKQRKAKKGTKSAQADAIYSSYHISWTDGPTVDEVESIINKYETSRFDSYLSSIS